MSSTLAEVVGVVVSVDVPVVSLGPDSGCVVVVSVGCVIAVMARWWMR